MKYFSLALSIIFAILLTSCTNNSDKLQSVITYTFKLPEHVANIESFETITDNIELDTIRSFMNENKDNNINAIGIRYSSYNTVKNCFDNTRTCKEFEVIISVKINEYSEVTSETKYNIKQYIYEILNKNT